MANSHFISIKQRTLTIGVVAGETSGDILGSGLIRAIKQQAPHARFFGVAGPLMKAEGCEVWYDMEDLAVMGIVEIIGKIPKLLKMRTNLTKRFSQLKPNVFLGIDAPEFNITLEGKLKKKGIKTIHYVSPSIWAWRKNRIFKIGRSTDLVLSFLPFEKQFYDQHNIACRFIGNATADVIPLQPDKQAARKQLNIPYDTTAKYLSILPGSRVAELEMLSADFLQSAQILMKDFPNLKILVPLVNQERRQQFEAIYRNITPTLPLTILDGQAHIAMIASDITLLASGTAALECMLAKCPMVVGYRMKPINYWFAKHLVQAPFISLPNLLAGDYVVKEFIQQECQPEKLAKSLKSLLLDEKKVEKLKQIFLQLHKSICCNADQQAADAVLKLSKNE